ncbi:uncharacterized protein METZ01_LOCUS100064 [marine metagenome]|uniref:biotin synthase n=1 Tax=marine metagenome TaxID=408172 RepID=A0A381W3V3_9ZZZZ
MLLARKEISVGSLKLNAIPRQDWSRIEVESLFRLPFNDLLYAAQWVHRQNFEPNTVQISTLVSIKTGSCPEDCAYCPQSIRYDTGIHTHELMSLEDIRQAAQEAKAAGATRFCMGAAYRGPKDTELKIIKEMIREVGELGLETCATLGLLTPGQAESLADSGLDYYNHNLDTSESFYPKIITPRRYQDRLETLKSVRSAGIKVCCGGILGMGESREDRIQLMHTLATLSEHPESVPINHLVKIPGTPLASAEALDSLEFVRAVGVARILMPCAHVRLSAGRTDFSDELQAMCFMAGANSIFFGDQLLTTDNPKREADRALLKRLGLKPEPLAAREA